MLLLFYWFSLKKLENFENILPLSNYEPNYFPNEWNSNKSLMNKHNCYSYFLDDFNYNTKSKPQPGYYSLGKDIVKKQLNLNNTSKYSDCNLITNRILSDNPQIYKVKKNEPCIKNFYKGFLALDPNNDYHFYRQDSNGFFSHKRGKNKVINKDSDGNLITDPSNANRKYSDYNYNLSCDFFCVPNNNFLKTNSL